MLGKRKNDSAPHSLSSTGLNAGRKITVWIYGLAALLIVLSAASLTFIAHMAWREADRKALESEQMRMDAMLKDIHWQIGRDQLSLAQWDKTFNAVQAPLDKEFIKDELVEYLWEDYVLDRTFIVGKDGMLIAEAVELETRFEPKQLPPDNLIRKLADQTRADFEAKRGESGSVFSDWYMPQSVLLDLSAATFALVDGTPAFLSAMPILPDDGQVQLNEDYPLVLVNAAYFDEDWIAEINDQLSFKDLHFQLGMPSQDDVRNHLVVAADGSVFGYFRWDHAKPGREIWAAALPLIFVLATLIAVVAFAAASKISRLSTSLEESERKNHYFARHDALTGLPNRHHFSDCLAFALDNLPDRPFAIFTCDLDRFKPVNDTYGHEAGDKVICAVADRLQGLVADKGVVSRIGGDEFIILVTSLSDKHPLQLLANQLRSAVAQPFDIGNGQQVEIGISIGIATAPDCGATEKDLIRLADMALYRAKDNGRNAFEFAMAPSAPDAGDMSGFTTQSKLH
ncbi:putative diguanylate cyclase AdrA [Labrenzia sp. THAF82]|uniref:sensor domain-containing diguanylate cyclase n=1 Tax=Labrenzia sp. THAF82 TaxID=2587861 RepID=UPI0012689271|nr:diguanylate cyclase [Labrenzia sp. THAF82]QFT32777.1 putative diguanylate cyclase AdrA [Labrenzia sp. THAF82]